MSSDEDGFVEGHIPLRPHPVGMGQAKQRALRPRKVLRPKPPSEAKRLEKQRISSAKMVETTHSVLQDALRKQTDNVFGAAAGMPFIPSRFAGMSLSKFGISDKGGLSANAQMSNSGMLGNLARTQKQRREGKSIELGDLAFTQTRKTADGQIRSAYAPISLPFFNFLEEEEESVDTGGKGKKGRPTLHHIDEANSNAAKELFLNSDGDLQEDQFFLVQLPAIMPTLADETDEVENPGGGAGVCGKMPDGCLGKLKIHKSGKVRMEIAGVQYCVDQGATSFFQQELSCVCPEAKELISLGSIQNRVVLTPDVHALLEAVDAPAQDENPPDNT